MPITSEQKAEIINVCSGFFNGAPGQAFLNDFTQTIESGATIEQLADAFEASTAFTSEILGGQTTMAAKVQAMMTNYGFTVGNTNAASADAMAEAFFTSQFEAGASVASVVLQAVNFMEGTVPSEFSWAQTLYNNKAAVAAAYSEVKSSTDINELQGLYSTLTGDAPITEDEIDAIVNPSTAFSLAGGVDDIFAAEDALDAFLLEAGQDPDVDGEEPALSEGDVATALTNAITAVDTVIVNDGSYTAASTGVRAAMIADAEEANDTALSAAQDTLDDANDAVAEVAGLTDAVSTLAAAQEAEAAANLGVDLANNSYLAAMITYNAGAVDDINAATGTTGGGGGSGASSTLISEITNEGTELLVKTVSGELVFAVAVTETTHPGVTALMEAASAYNTSIDDAIEAESAAMHAQAVVENLEAGAADLAELASLGALFTATTPDDADKPTVDEINAETASLTALLDAADAAAAANGDTDLATALATLQSDITTVGDGDAAGVAALTAAAVTDGYLTAADKAAIDADGAVAADANTAVDDNNAGQRSTDFATAKTDYDNAAIAAGTPLNDAQAAAESAVETAQGTIDALAEAVAGQATAQSNVEQLATLNENIADAIQAFEDEGLETPVELQDGVNAVATAEDDIFYTGENVTTDIINFNSLGSDSLVIGTNFTWNTDSTAGDNGDNNALEVWITEDGSDTLVTMETTEFGSNASTPEVAEITLVGVDAADVSLSDGVITVA